MKEKTYSYPYRFIHHLHTIDEHRYEVMKNCFACGLYEQGLTHDLSKYSPSEFCPSVRYFQGYRSPYAKEKEVKGYSLGWLHHKGHNRHHWEYWYDMIEGRWTPIKMPYRYLVEMVCDRVAACKVYQKEKYTPASPLAYFLEKHDKEYMHSDTARELENILRYIAEHGEEETFALLKHRIQSHYRY
jgi:hypothetical protein